MIRYYAQEGGKLTELDNFQHGCWINVSPPIEQEELEELSTRFDFSIDFLIDSLDIDERSRYEKDGEVRFVLINVPWFNEADQENEAIYITLPVGIILLGDTIITVCSKENAVLNRFFEGKVKHFNLADHKTFILQIFEQNVYYYLNCLKRLNLKRNIIERELYNSSRNEELKQLLRIEKSLVYFVNALSANDLLNLKMKRLDFLKIADNEDNSDTFEDIIIDNGQALQMANVYTNILNGTMEAYASIVSNNLNTFIQRLTIVTVVLMVPTLIASFYGMNVPVPFGKSQGSFYFIMIASALISLLLVWFFRRKNLY